MIEIQEYFNAGSKITQLQKLDNNLIAFNTKLHGITIFSHEKHTTKINFTNKYLNFETTALCFSSNSKLLAFANKTIIYVIHTSTNELINTIHTDDDIELITFDLYSNYIITGSKDGRVMQYKHNDNSPLARLCSFPYDRTKPFKKQQNFVSVFASYKNKLAVSGYGGAIFIIDLYSQANKDVIAHEKNHITALCFLNENTLISGDINGTIQILNIKEKKYTKK